MNNLRTWYWKFSKLFIENVILKIFEIVYWTVSEISKFKLLLFPTAMSPFCCSPLHDIFVCSFIFRPCCCRSKIINHLVCSFKNFRWYRLIICSWITMELRQCANENLGAKSLLFALKTSVVIMKWAISDFSNPKVCEK